MKLPLLIALPLFLLSACDSESTSNTAPNTDNDPTPLITEGNDTSTPVQNDPEQNENEPPSTEPESQDPTDADTQPTQEQSQPAPENAAGCVIPEAGTTIVSRTTPVHPNDNPYYYPVMGPQCVVPGSQFDGPGLAYGDFLLTNNAWNGQQSSFNWEQCIALTEAADGSILPSWTFDWGNEDDLQPGLFEWEVKSFPEIIYGYKSDEEISAPCTDTGLPVPVGNLPEIEIAYNYRATLSDNRVGDQGDEANNPTPVTGGDRNIAVESFFHTSCEIIRGDNSNMELELMVWLEMGNERLPSGQPPVSQYTSNAGHTYDVYTKSDNYVAYVAQNPVNAGTLNWSEFVNDTKANAGTYGVKTLQDSWCMANVIFGSEIWWGEGSVALDYYEVTSQY